MPHDNVSVSKVLEISHKKPLLFLVDCKAYTRRYQCRIHWSNSNEKYNWTYHGTLTSTMHTIWTQHNYYSPIKCDIFIDLAICSQGNMEIHSPGFRCPVTCKLVHSRISFKPMAKLFFATCHTQVVCVW